MDKLKKGSHKVDLRLVERFLLLCGYPSPSLIFIDIAMQRSERRIIEGAKLKYIRISDFSPRVHTRMMHGRARPLLDRLTNSYERQGGWEGNGQKERPRWHSGRSGESHSP